MVALILICLKFGLILSSGVQNLGFWTKNTESVLQIESREIECQIPIIGTKTWDWPISIVIGPSFITIKKAMVIEFLLITYLFD